MCATGVVRAVLCMHAEGVAIYKLMYEWNTV